MSKLEQLIKCIHGRHVYIQMHNYPDQDAIACATGLKELLNYYNIASTISYYGIIDKDNTIKMVELLDIDIHNVNELKIAEEDEIIIVDGQKGNTNMLDFMGDEIACIDHHKIQNTSCYRFYDIRRVGACSSIIAEYFFENNITMSIETATGLLYGLMVDTAHMMRGVTELDLEMFYKLYKTANLALIRTFEASSLKVSDLETYSSAISNLKIHSSLVIANIGAECSEAMLGTVSDFLLTISGIDFAVVYSYRNGGLKFSVRNAIDTIDASSLVRKALAGYGDGGGHQHMAAGFIPGVTPDMANEVSAIIEERFSELMNELMYNGL